MNSATLSPIPIKSISTATARWRGRGSLALAAQLTWLWKMQYQRNGLYVWLNVTKPVTFRNPPILFTVKIQTLTVETMEEVDVVPSNLVSRHVRVSTIFEMIDWIGCLAKSKYWRREWICRRRTRSRWVYEWGWGAVTYAPDWKPNVHRRGRAPQPWRWRFRRNVNMGERRLKDKWRAKKNAPRTINSSYNPAMTFDSISYQLLQPASQLKLQCFTSWNSLISILANWNKSCPVSPSFNVLG